MRGSRISVKGTRGGGLPMDDLTRLPARERVARYKSLAADAERLAGEARAPSVRQSYLVLAEQWRQLADEVEAHLGRAIIPPDARPDNNL